MTDPSEPSGAPSAGSGVRTGPAPDPSAGDRRLRTEPLQTISSFARAVGLSPSALRLYAEHGLVVPAEVDPRTGYRYYAPEQQRRAVMVRRLRDADLSLAEIQRVLDADREEATELLRRHAADSRARAERIGRILHDLEPVLVPAVADHHAAVSCDLDGPALADAVSQVVGVAAAPGDEPGLDGVLVEDTGTDVVVVATDRYQMLWRRLTASVPSGAFRRVGVPRPVVAELADWAGRRGQVRLVSDSAGARLTAPDGDFALPKADDRFPSHASVAGSVPPVVARVHVDRTRLSAMLGASAAVSSAASWVLAVPAGDAPIEIITTTPAGPVSATAVQVSRPADDIDGAAGPMVVHIAVGLLARMVDALVGRTVVLNLTAPDRPVLVHATAQPDLTGVIMPQRP